MGTARAPAARRARKRAGAAVLADAHERGAALLSRTVFILATFPLRFIPARCSRVVSQNDQSTRSGKDSSASSRCADRAGFLAYFELFRTNA